jgi:hypothetical protein
MKVISYRLVLPIELPHDVAYSHPDERVLTDRIQFLQFCDGRIPGCLAKMFLYFLHHDRC